MTGFRNLFLQILALLVFAASVLSFLFYEPIIYTSWDGISLIAVSSQKGDSVSLLTDALGADYEIYSFYNHVVEIPAYGEPERTLLSQVGSRFIENDPRYTDFLKKLPSLYRAFKDEHLFDIYYIKPELSYNELFEKISGKLEVNDFIIPDRPEEPSMAFLIIFVILLVISFLFQKGARIFSIFIGLPIIGFAFAGDFFSFFAACFLLLCIEFFFDIYRKSCENSSLGKKMFFALVLIPWGVVIILSAFIHKGSIPLMIWGVLPGWLSMIFLWKHFRLNKQKRRVHNLFSAVSIFKPDTVFLRRLPLIAGGILFLGGTFFYFFYMSSPISEFDVLELPRPMAEDDRYVTELLVSSDDYISHSYFVDSFLFGGEYKVPELNDTISRNIYQKTEDGFFRTEEVLFASDKNWFESAVSNAKGFMAYILDRGASPVLKQQRSRGLPDPFHLLVLIVYMMFLPLLALIEYVKKGTYKRKIFGITSGRLEI